MNLLSFLIVSFVGIFLIGILYLKFRNSFVPKYVYSDKPLEFYTRKRIYIRGIIFVVASVIFGVWLNSIMFVLNPNFWSDSEVFLTLIVANVFGQIFTLGIGLYFGVNIIEEYLLRKIKVTRESKILKLAMETLHGPLSHILQYQSAFLVFLTYSVYEVEAKIKNSDQNALYFILLALATASFITYALIKNNTWKHQIALSLFTLSLTLIYIFISDFSIENRFALFFLTFEITLCTLLIIKYLDFKIHKKSYYYDELDIFKYKDEIEIEVKE